MKSWEDALPCIQAYNKGIEAFKVGKQAYENPYGNRFNILGDYTESIEFKEWIRGWNTAYFKQQRKTRSIEKSKRKSNA
jgi:hypothetical protein